MLSALHMLGAAGDGLQSQYVVLNVRHVDVEKLKKALGVEGVSAAGLGAALSLADSNPKMALDIGLPLARNYLKDTFGVDAEISAADKAPPTRGKSEFWSGAGVGAGVTALVAGIGWATWRLVFRRIFS